MNLKKIYKNNQYLIKDEVTGRFVKSNTIQRFWSKVKKTDNCWEWQAGRVTQGYGRFYLDQKDQKEIKAHRYSWQLHYGEIPEGLCVLHKCDNPPCVRPDHLWLGTLKDNARDMVQKGRGMVNHQYGEDNNQSKLIKKQVLQIRKLYSTGEYTQAKLANQFRVSRRCIGYIVNNQQWKHIKT